MVEKDYLLRQIEKLGAMLVGIREKMYAGEPELALRELSAAAAQAGVTLEFLDILAPESLLSTLGETNLVRLLPAAEVLLLKGELQEGLGQTEESARSFEKAVLLARQVRRLVGEGSDPALQARVEALVKRVEELST